MLWQLFQLRKHSRAAVAAGSLPMRLLPFSLVVRRTLVSLPFLRGAACARAAVFVAAATTTCGKSRRRYREAPLDEYHSKFQGLWRTKTETSDKNSIICRSATKKRSYTSIQPASREEQKRWRSPSVPATLQRRRHGNQRLSGVLWWFIWYVGKTQLRA